MFDGFTSALRSVIDRVRGKKGISKHDFEGVAAQLRTALYDADVPHSVVNNFLESVHERVIGQELLKGVSVEEHVLKVMYDILCDFLGKASAVSLLPEGKRPLVCMMVGLQGSGKTTTIGKLAHLLREEEKHKGKVPRILCGSVDFQRPAAIDQLEIVAQRAACHFVRARSQHPLKAAEELYQYAQEGNYDIFLLDTAGRLHTENTLLDELEAIAQRIQPEHRILVIDGMIGQESLQVAQTFHARIALTGAIITKLDSGARAGVVLSFRKVVQQPILYVGVGEGLDDLEAFVPDRMARRLIGEGDLATLIEKARRRISEVEQEHLEQALMQGTFTLVDFQAQLIMMNKLGSLSSLIRYMPGGVGKMTNEQIEKGENTFKKFKAIINSMTRKERILPRLLNNSRKKRIARGAGVAVADIAELLRAFEQTQQFAKLMKNLAGSQKS